MLDLTGAILITKVSVLCRHTLQYRCAHGERNLGDAIVVEDSKDGAGVEFYSDLGSQEDPLQLWQNLVQACSSRILKFPVDRLLAISAVAQEYTNVLGPRYFAGIWEQVLIQQLTWVVEPTVRVTMMAVQIAPTWSWASRNEPVSWPHLTIPYMEVCRVFDASRDLQTARIPLEDANEASITLRGLLRQAWMGIEIDHLMWLDGAGSVSSTPLQWDRIGPNNLDEVICLPLMLHTDCRNDELDVVGSLFSTRGNNTVRVGCFDGLPYKELTGIPEHEITII